jgi:AraC family transcriptional regulator, regulatory protein of adaptative response / DNA-3-methyladenine glycosylase II
MVVQRRGSRSCEDARVARLSHHPALATAELVEFLARRAVPGVEEVCDGVYRRSLRDSELLELRPGDGHVDVAGDLGAARAVLRLDVDPEAIAAVLGGDPLLGPLVRGAPGRRIPGHADPAELAVRALLGQQISVAAARTLAGRLTAELGKPLAEPRGGVTHRFPAPVALAALDPETLPMPRARGRALVRLAAALAEGEPVDERLPGIGPWTTAYVALRSGDDDTFLPTDLGVKHGLSALGADPGRAAELAEAWQPYRGFAVAHLWAAAATPRRDPARGATG